MFGRLIDPYTNRDETPYANLLIHKLQKAYQYDIIKNMSLSRAHHYYL